MATTSKLFGYAAVHLGSAGITWSSADATIKCALLGGTIDSAQDTADVWTAISSLEASGTGYTAGGETMTSLTANYTATSNETLFDAADVSWTSSSFSARTAIVYNSTNSALISYYQLSAGETVSNGTFTIQWSTDGVFKATVS